MVDSLSLDRLSGDASVALAETRFEPQRPRILVVDDNPEIHHDFEQILAPEEQLSSELGELERTLFGDSAASTLQAEVVMADQGQQGVQLVESALQRGEPFSVAFVDCRMPPGWDGVETTRRMFELDDRIQVVLTTAYSDYSWEGFFEALGKSDRFLILKKPFEVVEVRQLAHALVEKWRLALENDLQLRFLEERVEERTRALKEANESLVREAAERSRLEGHLRVADQLRAVGQMAAGVAHELNTPVQFAADNLFYVRGRCLETNELQQDKALEASLDAVDEGLDRIARIVRVIRDLADNRPQHPREVDLEEAVNRTMTVARGQLPEGVRLELTVEEDLPAVRCDPVAFHQALLHLVINATEAVSEMASAPQDQDLQPLVAVAVGATNGNVEVIVRDNGPGIPLELQDRVFDPFFTSRGPEHMGRGLASALAIVTQNLSGSLSFESDPGSGTEFRMMFPCLAPEESS